MPASGTRFNHAPASVRESDHPRSSAPRALRRSDPIPPGPLAQLSTPVFTEVVSRDVRRVLNGPRAAELRTPELLDRWRAALRELLADVEDQLVTGSANSPWRDKAVGFHRALLRCQVEAAQQATPGPSTTTSPGPPLSPVPAEVGSGHLRAGDPGTSTGRQRRRASTRHGASLPGATALLAAIVAHRDHTCDDDCDDGCPADVALWALVSDF